MSDTTEETVFSVADDINSRTGRVAMKVAIGTILGGAIIAAATTDAFKAVKTKVARTRK